MFVLWLEGVNLGLPPITKKQTDYYIIAKQTKRKNMLYLTTASLNGEKYNKTIVSAKEVIDILGIQDKFDSDIVYFRVPSDYVKPNRDNEGVYDFQRALIPNEVHGVFKGQSLTLQYTPFPAPQGDGGQPIIKKNLIFQMLDPFWYLRTESQEIEKTLMVYLWKGNKNSPVRLDGRDSVYYETYDPEADAKLENQAFQSELDFLFGLKQEMMNDPYLFRVKAKGLDSLLSIPNLTTISDSELELILMKKAKNSLIEFKKAWNDPATAENGTLQDAIDKKVIDLKQVNGIPTWIWSDTKDIMVQVPQGTDARLKLREYFINNIGSVLGILQTKIQSSNLDEKSRAKEKVKKDK